MRRKVISRNLPVGTGTRECTQSGWRSLCLWTHYPTMQARARKHTFLQTGKQFSCARTHSFTLHLQSVTLKASFLLYTWRQFCVSAIAERLRWLIKCLLAHVWRRECGVRECGVTECGVTECGVTECGDGRYKAQVYAHPRDRCLPWHMVLPWSRQIIEWTWKGISVHMSPTRSVGIGPQHRVIKQNVPQHSQDDGRQLVGWAGVRMTRARSKWLTGLKIIEDSRWSPRQEREWHACVKKCWRGEIEKENRWVWEIKRPRRTSNERKK